MRTIKRGRARPQARRAEARAARDVRHVGRAFRMARARLGVGHGLPCAAHREGCTARGLLCAAGVRLAWRGARPVLSDPYGR